MLKKSNDKETPRQLSKREHSLIKTKDNKPDKLEKAKKASKVKFALEQEPKVDMYYYRIYRKLRLLRYLCVLLAALFVMSVPMVYSDQITTDNFKYLMKYINLQLSEDAEEYAPFSYESSQYMDFGIYSEDIVICTDSCIVFYDKLGNESLRVSYGPFQKPTMLISDTYVMVYDRGGNEYVILNNFKLLHRAKTSFPILHCALDDTGRYAVLTSNQNYTSEIQVYNRNFKQTNRIQRDLYVTDLFFTNSSETFGYTAFTTDISGQQFGEICLYDAQSQKKAELRENSIPLKAVSTGNTLKVLFANSLVWYDLESNEEKCREFTDNASTFFLSAQNSVIYFDAPSEESVGYTDILVNNENEPIKIVNTDSVKHIQWNEDRCYLIGTRTLTVFDTKDNTVSITNIDGLIELLFLPEGKLMGCYQDRTENILLSEFQSFEQN